KKFESAEKAFRGVESQDVGREFGDAAAPELIFSFFLELAIDESSGSFRNAPAPSERKGVPSDLAAHDVTRFFRGFVGCVSYFTSAIRRIDGEELARVMSVDLKWFDAAEN